METEDERAYACRQHCDSCKQPTDHYSYHGSKPICGACWERFWCGWVAIPETQKEALKVLRQRFKAGTLTEFPVAGVEGRWEPC